jgi:hypothetical protein
MQFKANIALCLGALFQRRKVSSVPRGFGASVVRMGNGRRSVRIQPADLVCCGRDSGPWIGSLCRLVPRGAGGIVELSVEGDAMDVEVRPPVVRSRALDRGKMVPVNAEHRLVTYGTLAPGRTNHHQLARSKADGFLRSSEEIWSGRAGRPRLATVPWC